MVRLPLDKFALVPASVYPTRGRESTHQCFPDRYTKAWTEATCRESGGRLHPAERGVKPRADIRAAYVVRVRGEKATLGVGGVESSGSATI